MIALDNISHITNNYEIVTPKLHNERTARVTQNHLLGDITYDYSEKVLSKYGLEGVSFCFFIKWNNGYKCGRMMPDIWIKKEIYIEENKKVYLKSPEFMEKFLSVESLEKIKSKNSFFSRYELDLSYIIVRHIKDAHIHGDENVAINYKYKNNKFFYYYYTYDELKQCLYNLSGGAIYMGKKLVFYETELEKILSEDKSPKTAPFPGDCDLLLYDKDTLSCKAIIEFKKRTNFGKIISIKNQTISNYISHDYLKYQRLNLLRCYFEKNVIKKFLCLLYIIRPLVILI